MALLPHLPILPRESLISYISRIARYHGNTSTFDFLNVIEMSRHSVLRADPEALIRLASMTGNTPERLLDSTWSSLGVRLHEHRGERFHSELLAGKHTTYCPACLLEADNGEGIGGSQRVGLVDWMFTPVRTCQRHRIPLIRRRNQNHAEGAQDMNFVAPSTDQLMKELGRCSPREVSDLQSYVDARFNGGRGATWLDGQQVDQAARACEMLGFVHLFDPNADLKKLTVDDWDRAGHVGYQFAKCGSEGIHECLADVLKREQKDRDVKGGPQKVFGKLYKWLQYGQHKKSVGPIQEVVREFVLDRMHVAEGTILLGQRVDRSKVHSVASLAAKSGIHPRTINRLVVGAGLIEEGDVGLLDARLVFEAEAGERLAESFLRAIPINQLPEALNCNRTQAEVLAREGVIPLVMNGAGGIRTTRIDLDEVEIFLKKLRSYGRVVELPGDGMLDMIDAAQAVRFSVVKIVRMVLRRELKNIELIDAGKRFRSIFVDPEEIREKLAVKPPEHLMSKQAVATMLGASLYGVGLLTRERDDAGNLYLEPVLVRNGRGKDEQFFEVDAVKAFMSRHVELSNMASEMGVSVRKASNGLRDRGIEPILPITKLGRSYYRRAQI